MSWSTAARAFSCVTPARWPGPLLPRATSTPRPAGRRHARGARPSGWRNATSPSTTTSPVGRSGSALPDDIAVEEITTPAGLVVLLPEWLELWRCTPAATPFQSPAWLLPWWNAFGCGELLTLAIRVQGRLAG